MRWINIKQLITEQAVKYIYTKVAGFGVLEMRRDIVPAGQRAVMRARLRAIVLRTESRESINNITECP